MKHIKTQPTGNGTEIATEEYNYRDVVISCGFESDGATVPRFLWWLYPPFYPDYKTASFVHDNLCRLEQYAKADRYFYELLVKGGVKKSTRRNFVKAVSLWHKVAYKNNKDRAWLRLYRKITKI